MHDVLSTITRSDRLLLAVSFICFAAAGATGSVVDTATPTLAATAVAIAGVYGVASYATRVSRRALATLALGFWVAFLSLTGFHVVGLETVGLAVPGNGAVYVYSLVALTWGTLLTACAATTFLGFREYGATTSADAPEEKVLESESYDTR